MTIDKNMAKVLGEDVAEALRAVAEKHGLEVEVRGGTYDPSVGTFKPRVEFKTSDSAANEFAMYADMFGLSADDFGREFTSRGRTFRIAGIAPRSPKRPILAVEVATGRTFKFTDDGVKVALLAA